VTVARRPPKAIVSTLASRVPATQTREHISGAITCYFASFQTREVDVRLELFADEVRFEDPAGYTVASNRAALRRFWLETIPTDWDVRFVLDRVAVVGDEALATATMTIDAPDTLPVDVVVNCHFAFGRDGRIRTYRAFFDRESIVERR
jgi:ketosteroid isomerase-like protein